MLDPMSLAAVSATVRAVGAGAAGEAGKQAWEALGVLARRLLGREVPAPASREERDALAARLLDAVSGDPALTGDLARWVRTAPEHALPRAATAVGGTAPVGASACRLPSTTRHFTDRTRVFRRISTEARRPGYGSRAVLLYGPEGVGASATAVHWVERHSGRFPDGRLYVDLRGGSGATALRPAQVLRLLLGGLGVPEERVPATLEDRRALYHRLCEGRRMLVVLDHVHTAAEAEPLLGPARGVLTLLVSHRRLPGIEACELAVEPLAHRDARRLLASIVGKSRARRDRSDMRLAVRRCAGSPLALTALGRRLLDDPARTRTWLAGADGAAGGEAAGEWDPAVAVAELACRGLSPEAALLYRTLALRPWPDFGAGAAAAAARLTEDEARTHLAELASRRLLEHDGAERYRFRPAVREHAERSGLDGAEGAGGPGGGEAAEGAGGEGTAERAAALGRLTDWYLRFAVEADQRALPQRWHLGPLYRAYEGRTVSPEQSRAALGELRRESGNLVEAVRTAESLGDVDRVLQLCEALWALLLKTGLHDELLPALRIGARTAAGHRPGTRMSGRLHTQLAYALGSSHSFGEAAEAQRAAAEAERAAGHKRGEATALEALGVLLLRQWRYAEAEPFFDEAAAVLETVAPDEEGAGDVPRARAILCYHLARVRRGQGRTAEAEEGFDRARRLFAALPEPDRFNEAKALTGAAGTRLDAGDPASAVTVLDEALATLEAAGGAELQHADIVALRARCVEVRDR